jgi:hypothetical protein
MKPTAPSVSNTCEPIDGDGNIASLDCEGRPITLATCLACAHADLRAQGGCQPGRSCVQDVYARRIDRFFHSHPQRAAQHLHDAYFEVRAIAARHADLFQLTPLLNDPDETVRLQLALRLPQRQLLKLRDDPHREVRIRVAWRIDAEHLTAMLRDVDYQVRSIVARRLPDGLLPLLMHDPDLQVRLEVARRLPMPALWRLCEDGAPEVRRIAAERLPVALLEALACDSDWTVRWEAAGRATGHALHRLLADCEPEVRGRAAERLRALSSNDPKPTALEPAHG